MKKPKKIHRKAVRYMEDIHNDGWDFLPPLATLEFNNRLRALAEVLCRIPHEDYVMINDATFGKFIFNIPRFLDNRLGSVTYHGESPYYGTVYLSPKLESEPYEIAVYVVAHEFAHIVLVHHTQNCDSYGFYLGEREADKKVSDWGFKKEWRMFHKPSE